LNEDLRWEDQEQAVLSPCSSLVAVVGVHGSRVVQISYFPAQACLGISIHLDHSIGESGITDFSLARYAADHIGDHAEIGEVLSRIQDGVDHLLDPDKPRFAAWLWLRRNLSWGRFPKVVPLYCVAEFGFYGRWNTSFRNIPMAYALSLIDLLPLYAIALRTKEVNTERLRPWKYSVYFFELGHVHVNRGFRGKQSSESDVTPA
jgi:hypothetical protein